MQHGRLKVRTTAEQQEIKARERAKKLVIYKTAMDKIFTKVIQENNNLIRSQSNLTKIIITFQLYQRKAGELDDEILRITAQVLTENPDISTLWNIRKETILKIKEEK